MTQNITLTPGLDGGKADFFRDVVHQYRGLARAENLRECIAGINDLEPMPNAIIHTGDMTQHGQATEFAHARSLLAVLDVPLYVTPGNRDGREGIARAFANGGYRMPIAPTFAMQSRSIR